MVNITLSISTDELLYRLTPDNPFSIIGVTWADYENIVREFSGTNAFRVSFNRGILKIVRPSPEHEHFAELLKILVFSAAEYLKTKIKFFGTTRISNSALSKAVEPDASYFVNRVGLVKGMNFDIGKIPPDVVVEIDIDHADINKFEIYASFGIPEYWIYDNRQLKMFRLQENKNYQEISASVELEVLKTEVLTDFLNRSKREGQFDVVSDFEHWLKEQNK